MNFPCRKRRLLVKTLGGDEKEIDGKIYDCKIMDRMGRVYHFKAHGLDRVTGYLGDVPSKSVLQKLFPQMPGAWNMTTSQDVDYLIGMGRASWQPTRYERARLGGDF